MKDNKELVCLMTNEHVIRKNTQAMGSTILLFARDISSILLKSGFQTTHFIPQTSDLTLLTAIIGLLFMRSMQSRGTSLLLTPDLTP